MTKKLLNDLEATATARLNRIAERLGYDCPLPAIKLSDATTIASYDRSTNTIHIAGCALLSPEAIQEHILIHELAHAACGQADPRYAGAHNQLFALVEAAFWIKLTGDALGMFLYDASEPEFGQDSVEALIWSIRTADENLPEWQKVSDLLPVAVKRVKRLEKSRIKLPVWQRVAVAVGAMAGGAALAWVMPM